MPPEMGDIVKGSQRELAAVKDKVAMLKPGDDVVTGIRALDTAGHTPGHLSFEVAGGEGLIITGRRGRPTTSSSSSIPSGSSASMRFPTLAIQNRKALLDRAATDKIKLLGYHWTSPASALPRRTVRDTAASPAG